MDKMMAAKMVIPKAVLSAQLKGRRKVAQKVETMATLSVAQKVAGTAVKKAAETAVMLVAQMDVEMVAQMEQ